MADSPVHLKVGLRVCPIPVQGKKSPWTIGDKEITIVNPEDSEQISQWTFPYILPRESLQQQMYGEVASELLESVIEQTNGCMLVYGQPKSGKTYTVFGEEGLFELSIRRIVSEIKNEERGIRASLACVAVHDGVAQDLLHPDGDEVELAENMGLFGIPKTTWVTIKSIAESLAIVRKAVAGNESLPSEEKPHTFVLFTISRAKSALNPISSMVIGDMATLSFPDSVSLSINHTSLLSSSLVILGKLLTELCSESRDDSILVSKSMNGEWVMSLLACIATNEDMYENCVDILTYANKAQNYPEVIYKLKRKETKDASIEDKRINQLRSDIIDVKFDLQQMDLVHSKRLRELSVKFGFDFDVGILREADPMSREAKVVRNLRESVERVETCKQIKTGYDKKLARLNTLMAEARQVSSQNQVKRNQELQNLEEQVRSLKDLIDEITPGKLPDLKVQEVSRLQEMFEANKGLIQKHSQSLTELQSIASTRSDLANSDTESRKEGREQLELQYRTNYKAVETEAKEKFREIIEEYERKIKGKDEEREALEKKIRLTGFRKADRLQAYIDESARLALSVKNWFELIESIKRGDFNEGVVPVVIPRSHMPDFPEDIVSKYVFAGSGYLKLPKVREPVKDTGYLRSPGRKLDASRPSLRSPDDLTESNLSKLQSRLLQNLEVITALQAENRARRLAISSHSTEIEDLRSTRICFKRLLRQQQQANRVPSTQMSHVMIETNREHMRHVFVTAPTMHTQQSSLESSLSGYDSLNVGSSLSAYTSRSSKSTFPAKKQPQRPKEGIFEIAEY